jgi:hypothetical protein
VAGDQGERASTMPLELRVVARDSASKTWGVNADCVYQGWKGVACLESEPQLHTSCFELDCGA